MRFHKVVQITLHPSLLESSTAGQPNGVIHLAVSRNFLADGDEVFQKDNGEAHITDAALCAEAKAFFARCAAYYAQQNDVPVQASDKKGEPMVFPATRAEPAQ